MSEHKMYIIENHTALWAGGHGCPVVFTGEREKPAYSAVHMALSIKEVLSGFIKVFAASVSRVSNIQASPAPTRGRVAENAS